MLRCSPVSLTWHMTLKKLLFSLLSSCEGCPGWVSVWLKWRYMSICQKDSDMSSCNTSNIFSSICKSALRNVGVNQKNDLISHVYHYVRLCQKNFWIVDIYQKEWYFPMVCNISIRSSVALPTVYMWSWIILFLYGSKIIPNISIKINVGFIFGK